MIGVAATSFASERLAHPIEFLDKEGTQVLTFFGVRERGKPQPQAWHDLADSLPRVR